MPTLILFAKICPERIEATTFAFLTGTFNFTGVMRGFIGSYVNEWSGINVTEFDLSRYAELVLISFFCGLTPLIYLWLLPTKKQIEDLAIKMKADESDKVEIGVAGNLEF